MPIHIYGRSLLQYQLRHCFIVFHENEDIIRLVDLIARVKMLLTPDSNEIARDIRILLKGQFNPKDNGIYSLNIMQWTIKRVEDFDIGFICNREMLYTIRCVHDDKSKYMYTISPNIFPNLPVIVGHSDIHVIDYESISNSAQLKSYESIKRMILNKQVHQSTYFNFEHSGTEYIRVIEIPFNIDMDDIAILSSGRRNVRSVVILKSLDGSNVNLHIGDYVLLTCQLDSRKNGIYTIEPLDGLERNDHASLVRYNYMDNNSIFGESHAIAFEGVSIFKYCESGFNRYAGPYNEYIIINNTGKNFIVGEDPMINMAFKYIPPYSEYPDISNSIIELSKSENNASSWAYPIYDSSSNIDRMLDEFNDAWLNEIKVYGIYDGLDLETNTSINIMNSYDEHYEYGVSPLMCLTEVAMSPSSRPEQVVTFPLCANIPAYNQAGDVVKLQVPVGAKILLINQRNMRYNGLYRVEPQCLSLLESDTQLATSLFSRSPSVRCFIEDASEYSAYTNLCCTQFKSIKTLTIYFNNYYSTQTHPGDISSTIYISLYDRYKDMIPRGRRLIDICNLNDISFRLFEDTSPHISCAQQNSSGSWCAQFSNDGYNWTSNDGATWIRGDIPRCTSIEEGSSTLPNSNLDEQSNDLVETIRSDKKTASPKDPSIGVADYDVDFSESEICTQKTDAHHKRSVAKCSDNAIVVCDGDIETLNSLCDFAKNLIMNSNRK